MTTRTFTTLLAALLALSVAACTAIEHTPSAALERDAAWAVLPMVNHTETPQAALRAEAIAEALLRAQGVGNVKRYPAALSQDALLDPQERRVQDDAMGWARQQGVRYALTGSVDEWRYKVGIDGEPAVGVTLAVVDVHSGATLWSGTGGKSGWSREALSAVAQKLMRELIATAGIR